MGVYEPGQGGNTAALSISFMCDGFLFKKMKKPEYYMNLALKEAEKAAFEDEIPIGCVIVKDDKVIARGHNKREGKNLVISHAEIETISKANKKLKSWRLVDCDIYVTVEPCLMCTGAIIQSRIKNIYFGAKDSKGGALGSSINALDSKNLNHYPNVIGGVLEEKCAIIIKNYFKNKRK